MACKNCINNTGGLTSGISIKGLIEQLKGVWKMNVHFSHAFYVSIRSRYIQPTSTAVLFSRYLAGVNSKYFS